MYRLVIEHPEWIPKDWQAKLDLRAGSDRGRIYRVLPEQGEPRPVPRLDKLSPAELAALVDGPNGTLRDLAVQRIVEDRLGDAVEGLRRVARVGRTPAGRAAAAATLAVLDELDHDTTLTALDDSAPQVRVAALRVASQSRAIDGVTVSTSAGERVAIRTATSAADTDPAVRFQAAVALGSLDRPDASRALGRLISDATSDKYLSAAVVSSMTKRNLPQTVVASLDETALRKLPAGGVIEMLIDSAAGYDDRRSLERLMLVAVATTDVADQTASIAALLDGLSRHRLSLAALRESASDEGREIVAALQSRLAEARRTAASLGADTSRRIVALAVFGRNAEYGEYELAVLAELLAPQTPDALRAAAIDALGKFPSADAAEMLLSRWTTFTAERKRQIVAACLNRNTWAERLVAAVAEKRVAGAEIDVTSTQRLLNHPERRLRDAATRALAAAIDPDRAAVVEKYLAAVTSAGDAARGRTLFTKSCGPCHKIGDVGTPTGPDLAALSDRSTKAMLTSIFDPNRAVESKYVGYTAITDAGLTYNGLLIAESDATVTLVGADGKQQTLRRGELEEFAGTGRSFMPVGMEKDVSPEGAADLLAFLEASRTPPRSFTGNEPRLVRPEALRGELYLLADAAAAYGDTLEFVGSPPRFTTWTGPGERVEWEFEIVQAGEYELSIEYACPNGAGGAFVVDCAGTRHRGRAEPTGGREAFRSVALGPVQLAAGRHRAVVRSDGPIEGEGLFDLTSLRLRRK
jgi:putative heme-binding domain-containing protein